MVQLLKGKPKVTVVTEDGKCDVNIKLDLNLNINTNDIRVSVDSKSIINKKEDDDESFMIPDFEAGGQIKFGEQCD